MSADLLLMRERAKLYRLAQPHRDYLAYIRDAGLSVKSLADPDPFDWVGTLAVTPIGANWEGGFDFVSAEDPHAVIGAVCEVYGSDAETVLDLVGWPVDAPERTRCMFQRADMLGAWNVHSATSYTFGKPLLVHRTPLGWLQAGCQGVVLLNPKEAARRLLDAPGRIAGEDQDHTKELADLVADLFDMTRFVAPVSSDQRKAA